MTLTRLAVALTISLFASFGVTYAQTVPALTDCQQNQESPDRVVYGSGGHMFIVSQDFRIDIPADKYVSQFAEVSRALQVKGIKLVIVPLAYKGLVDVKHLDLNDPVQRFYDWSLSRKTYRGFVQKLKALNVTTVDTLTPALVAKQQFFNKTDWHWTSEGSRLIADRVAATIRGLPVSRQLPPKQFKTTVLPDRELDGGSAYYASQIEKRCGVKLSTRETIHVYQTSAIDPSVGLLDDDAPDVVLAGTSFSAAPWNFEGFLKQALGVDVLGTAVIGGGVHSSLQSYLMSAAFLSHPPKVLVWEFDFDRLYDTPLEQKHWSQLLAMTQADCTNASPQTPAAVVSPETILEITQQVHPGILRLQFSDLSLRFFDATPSSGGVAQEIRQAGRWDFITNNGAYYLPVQNADHLKITIPDFQKNVSGTVAVTQCQTH